MTFARDCPAVLIPAGEHVTLPEGSTGFMTQALGGSFTIYIEGNLFRIAGRDGDAIGKPALSGPELPDDATEAEIEAAVWQQMRTCYDPEIPINIVELGLVYECKHRARALRQSHRENQNDADGTRLRHGRDPRRRMCARKSR